MGGTHYSSLITHYFFKHRGTETQRGFKEAAECTGARRSADPGLDIQFGTESVPTVVSHSDATTYLHTQFGSASEPTVVSHSDATTYLHTQFGTESEPTGNAHPPV